MAINDISLTSGMRTNLTSLQSTVTLLNRTQERLSTGKKVNNALDNPLNFFTAQALTSRANDLSGFKDAMSEAVQTVKAANNGITAITGLIEQAKAIAASAKTTAEGVNYKVDTITIGSVTSGETINIGGVTFTATKSTGMVSGNSATQNNGYFLIGATAADTATSLKQAITATSDASWGGAVSGVVAGKISVQSDLSSGTTIMVQNHTADMTVATASQGTGTGTNMTVGALSSPYADRANYYSQYTDILTQIDNIAADSNYKGTNLLGTTNHTLDVSFGTGMSDKLTITGFDATSTGTDLGMIKGTDWNTNNTIDSAMTAMDAAVSTLKAKSSSLASGLSIVNTRQDWVNSMVTTLTQGSDNLTLADMNEEGANMLMLQTRQALGTTALSLSSQAAQSVLKLFA
jgi:flagellin-like hook-associated protein FlgL